MDAVIVTVDVVIGTTVVMGEMNCAVEVIVAVLIPRKVEQKGEADRYALSRLTTRSTAGQMLTVRSSSGKAEVGEASKTATRPK